MTDTLPKSGGTPPSDQNEGAAADTPPGTGRRFAKARGVSGDRIAALKRMRGTSMATEEIEGRLTDAKGRTRKMRDRLAGSGDAPREKRMQMLVKMRALLTQTPADAGGTVEGTPFTTTGVAKLMSTLESRAANGSAPGARVAGSLRKFLSAGADEPAVAGASVKKLQLVADRMEKMKGRVAKSRKGQ